MIIEEAKELHYMAYHLYRDKQYEQASVFFNALVLDNPQEPKYWKGLGACLQMTQNMKEALHCYMEAQNLQKARPDPYLFVHAADCYFALQRKEEGLKALEAAFSSGNARQDARVLKHVATMRQMWK